MDVKETMGLKFCTRARYISSLPLLVPGTADRVLYMARKSGRESTPAKGRSSPGCHAWGAQEEERQLSLTPEPSVLFLAWMGAQNGVWVRHRCLALHLGGPQYPGAKAKIVGPAVGISVFAH